MGLKTHTKGLKVVGERTDIPYNKPEVLVQRKANPSQDGDAKPTGPTRSAGLPAAGTVPQGGPSGAGAKCIGSLDIDRPFAGL
jgi:hypothetical protein